MKVSNKLFRKFIRLHKLTKNLSDEELDLLIGEVYIFRGNISQGKIDEDDIDLIEDNLKKKK